MNGLNIGGILDMAISIITDQNEQKKPAEVDEDKALWWVIDHGPGRDGGKVRVYAAGKRYKDEPDKMVEFLKEEYGVGGNSLPGDYWFEDYNGRGISVKNMKDWSKQFFFTWKRMAREYIDAANNGRFSSALLDMRTMQRAWEVQRTIGLMPIPVPRLDYPTNHY